jgi:chorismate mutase/prephenate dehydratase
MKRNRAVLDRLRRQVDAQDRKLLSVLNARMRLTAKIARIKRAERLPVYAPDREEALLRALERANKGPLTAEGLRAIYREVLSASRALSEPIRVAYLGPEGTFTHQAAERRFGSQAEYAAAGSIPDVFYEVDRRKAHYGVVPVENSSEGAVNYTLDMFMDSEVKICAEERMPIRHVLMTKATRKDAIHELHSHPQVFGQCRRWIEIHLPKARLIAHASTGEAARAAAGKPNAAAIGPELAASLNGLPVLARGLEDIADNVTRFFVLAKSWSPRTGQDKTSVMLSLKDRVGALHAMLVPFRRNRINLTSIESRPSRKRPWEYCFFVDFEGHLEDRPVARALAALEPLCSAVKILGSYPAAR